MFSRASATEEGRIFIGGFFGVRVGVRIRVGVRVRVSVSVRVRVSVRETRVTA